MSEQGGLAFDCVGVRRVQRDRPVGGSDPLGDVGELFAVGEAGPVADQIFVEPGRREVNGAIAWLLLREFLEHLHALSRLAVADQEPHQGQGELPIACELRPRLAQRRLCCRNGAAPLLQHRQLPRAPDRQPLGGDFRQQRRFAPVGQRLEGALILGNLRRRTSDPLHHPQAAPARRRPCGAS